MGTPNRIPDDESDERLQKHWETYEGKVVDPRLTTNADPHEDVRFDTHLRPGSVVPTNTGASLKVLAAVMGLILLALVSYWLFRSEKQSPRTPGAPTGRLQQTPPVRTLSMQELLPLARLHRQGRAQHPQQLIAEAE